MTQAARESRPFTTSSDRADLLRTVPSMMLVVATALQPNRHLGEAGNEPPRQDPRARASRGWARSPAFLLVYTLAMLPGGWFIDRFGPRVALMVVCFGSTVFVALTGVVGLVADGPWTLWLGLMAVRSLLGLLNAPLHPASARMVYNHLPPRSRAMANGLVTAAACAGIAATYYAFGKLIDLFDWPVAFLVSSGLTLIVGLGWVAGTRTSTGPTDLAPSERAAFDLSALWPILRRRSVVCIALSYAAYGYFQYLFFYWTEYYFATIQKVGQVETRRYSTMITVAMGTWDAAGGCAGRSQYFAGRSTPMAEGPRAGGGDDRQRGRLRAGAARSGCADHAGGVHPLGWVARALRGGIQDDGRRARPPSAGRGRRPDEYRGNAGAPCRRRSRRSWGVLRLALWPRPGLAAEPRDRGADRDRRCRLLVGVEEEEKPPVLDELL